MGISRVMLFPDHFVPFIQHLAFLEAQKLLPKIGLRVVGPGPGGMGIADAFTPQSTWNNLAVPVLKKFPGPIARFIEKVALGTVEFLDLNPGTLTELLSTAATIKHMVRFLQREPIGVIGNNGMIPIGSISRMEWEGRAALLAATRVAQASLEITKDYPTRQKVRWMLEQRDEGRRKKEVNSRIDSTANMPDL